MEISNSNEGSIEHSIIAQYGYNRAVPILQVFDEEGGLGSPYANYKMSQTTYSMLDKKRNFLEPFMQTKPLAKGCET